MPAAKPKVLWKELAFEVWIPESGGLFGLRRIAEGEWWAGMWEFARGLDADELAAELEPGWVEHLGRFRHMVTSHKISVAVSLARGCRRGEGFEWLTREELEGRALPAPQRKAWGMVQGLLGP